ncbi:uncharacterized protein LOC133490084 isoform X2 [Phyllopteryx taeniolatus]|uniref:uncharacterized protein LOC133490084 isoform X2 n=1 Tax=Phyllopteryx taeniolatus TaxID=161469 RepID=UPI002AD35AE3|nr:uncharacterized protein LOC133490084 isoform X2 [Phyllopteryx taeniolatus]
MWVKLRTRPPTDKQPQDVRIILSHCLNHYCTTTITKHLSHLLGDDQWTVSLNPSASMCTSSISQYDVTRGKTHHERRRSLDGTWRAFHLLHRRYCIQHLLSCCPLASSCFRLQSMMGAVSHPLQFAVWSRARGGGERRGGGRGGGGWAAEVDGCHGDAYSSEHIATFVDISWVAGNWSLSQLNSGQRWRTPWTGGAFS